jgi:hypothetical protein
MDGCVYSVFVLGSGLATGSSLVQRVLPNVLDKETEVKRRVSRMTYAPSASNRNKPTNQFSSTIISGLFNKLTDQVAN